MEETAGPRRAGDRPGSRNVPLYSLPRITYLTSLGRERTMNGDIHKSSLLCSSRFFTSVDGFPPYVRFIPVLLAHPLCPALYNSPRSPRLFGSSTFGSTFSRPVVSPPLNENGLERLTGASDLLRVRKLELKELSTSGNPREIYRRARAFMNNISRLCSLRRD